MKTLSVLCLLAASIQAHAATFTLDLQAANGSRWYEYFSGAYAELGKNRTAGGDGFWGIPDGAPVGDGTSDVFRFDGIWSSLGTLTYTDAGLTNTGVESAPITAFTANFASYIADNDSITNGPYLTTINSAAGTVSLIDGVVSSIQLNVSLTFTYDGSGFGLGNLDYGGTFVIDGNSFSLDADGSYPTFPGLEDARYVWDVNGIVTNVVPEPSAALLGSLGLLALARRRR